jgi:predicted MFS family arabinose efflux permease
VRTLGGALGAVGLLALFGAVESRRAAPLVRLSIFRTRTLTTVNGVTVLLVGGLYSLFFFGTLYFQQIKGYNALESGVAFLPQTIGIIGGSVISQTLIARFGPKAVLAGGLATAAAGLLWMTTLTPDGSYWTGFLPGLVLLALGMGNAFVPLTLIATSGVAPDDQGLASGLFNTSQQIGGALGLAVLSTVASQASAGAHGSRAAVLTHGYTTAFGVGTALLVAAAAVVVVALRRDDAAAVAVDEGVAVDDAEAMVAAA